LCCGGSCLSIAHASSSLLFLTPTFTFSFILFLDKPENKSHL
jgi:hypothetical protein